MPIIGIAGFGVFYTCGGKKLSVRRFIGLTSAKPPRESAFRRRPLERIVVLKLIEKPVVEIEGYFVFGAICVLLGLGNCRINNARNAGIHIIRNLNIRVGAQVVNARCLIHEVKAEVVCSGSHRREREVVAYARVGVLCPLSAAWICDRLVGVFIGIGVRGRIHPEKIAATAACCAHMEGRWLSKYWIVPFDCESDAAVSSAIAVLISTYCGLCGLFRIRRHVGC